MVFYELLSTNSFIKSLRETRLTIKREGTTYFEETGELIDSGYCYFFFYRGGILKPKKVLIINTLTQTQFRKAMREKKLELNGITPETFPLHDANIIQVI